MTTHALGELQARGTLFVRPQEDTYNGMVIGESTRDADMEVTVIGVDRMLGVPDCDPENCWNADAVPLTGVDIVPNETDRYIVTTLTAILHGVDLRVAIITGEPCPGEEAQQRAHDGS